MKTTQFNFTVTTSLGVNYSAAFDYSDISAPKKIEATLEAKNVQLGINDSSLLQVILQRSIDGVNWIDHVSPIDGEFFKPVFIDESEDKVNEIQDILIHDNQFLGNQLRVKSWVSQTGSVPSSVDVTLAILVK